MDLNCKTPARFTLLVLIALGLAACGGASAQTPSDLLLTPTPDIEIPIEDLLVFVPGGPFIMGSDPEIDSQARQDEFPERRVTLSGFFIYRNEVTNQMYAQCVEAGQCTPPVEIEDEDDPEVETASQHYRDPEYKDHPVVGVNWHQADAFCGWLNARLPSEAEWEKTARGELGALYPWGDDKPLCDRANGGDCILDTITEKIGQLPLGSSFYEANDLAGNVWEWTADWYHPEYYEMAGSNNPQGPLEGELKVVRGGSYLDDEVNLRSAARYALDPEQAYNEVGFRCVPIGVDAPAGTRAPFCEPSYIPFCTDPNDPGDECVSPPHEDGSSTDFEWLGFTCPRDGYITFTIDGGGRSAADYDVTINGIPYNCIDSTVYPGRWICEGTAQSQGTLVNISACPAPQAGLNGPQLAALTVAAPAAVIPQTALVGYQPQPQAPAALQAFAPPAQKAQQAAAFAYCPEGTVFDPQSNECISQDNACPQGWTYDTATLQCVLDGEDGCPEGTRYNADVRACVPGGNDDDGEPLCPSPLVYDRLSGTCQPPNNNDGGGLCGPGYFYDTNIMCCSPVQGRNESCGDGGVLNPLTGTCEMQDVDGCPEGTVYNRYDGVCYPITLTRTQSNNGSLDCAGNQYPDTRTQQCVDLPLGSCATGYYYDARQQVCVPTQGPGSGCAPGYTYSQRLNCCVGNPGTDGSSCAGEEGQSITLRSFTHAIPAGSGFCDPGTTSTTSCPDGYYFDRAQQTCMPLAGTTPTNGMECATGMYYDEAYGACFPIGQGGSQSCGAGQYFDYELGYCVQTSCGCALGYTFNERTQTCQLTSTTSTEGCWTITQSVPVCEFQPTPTPVCPVGEMWDQIALRCDDIPDDGPDTVCSQYTTSRTCTAAGCTPYTNPNGMFSCLP